MKPNLSVQRALQILDLFKPGAAELSLEEITAALALSRDLTAGLVGALAGGGYLARNPVSTRYRLGLKLIERAAVALNLIELRQLAIPALHELHRELDENVNLAVLDGAEMVYLERLFSSRDPGMRPAVGQPIPAYCTALGKAVLASLPLDAVLKILGASRFTAYTRRTLLTPDGVLEELDLVRMRGYAVDDEEVEPEVRCVAAPVFDREGRPAAAISVSLPAARLPLEQLPALGSRVHSAARAISINLGHLPRTDRSR